MYLTIVAISYSYYGIKSLYKLLTGGIYCKSGNFHVKIIHVLNIQIDLFSWVCDTHENILT